MDCIKSLKWVMMSNIRDNIFQYLFLQMLTCYDWSNNTFTWVYYKHIFYYTLITTGHINNCENIHEEYP